MASLYKRPRSPYFWIKFRDSQGRLRQRSTEFRHDVPDQVRKARALEAEHTAAELRRRAVHTPRVAAQGTAVPSKRSGWAWVPDFLSTRYRSASFERYLCAWRTLSLFLRERRITSPAHVERRHATDYLQWRSQPNFRAGKYRACHNTAILEIKLLSLLVQEALQRGLASGNPLTRLHIKRDRPKLKPELSDQDYADLDAAIARWPHDAERRMLNASLLIARHQGCRLSETRVQLAHDIDFTAGTITFRAKGGRDHTTALHPALVPHLRQWMAEGFTETWTPPDPNRRQWAACVWQRFLTAGGFKTRGITFHCTRVTVASALARSGVPEAQAMRFIGHSTVTVHRQYQRVSLDDLSSCIAAIKS